MMDIKRSCFYGLKVLWQKNLWSGVFTLANKSAFNNETKQTKHWLKSYTKQLSENLKKRAVYSIFKSNFWGANLADMQLISKFNKEIRFLLCVIDIHSKYDWVFPLKDKKGVTIVSSFQNILKTLKRKPNKIFLFLLI